MVPIPFQAATGRRDSLEVAGVHVKNYIHGRPLTSDRKNLVFVFMDAAISYCRIALALGDAAPLARARRNAKKSYGCALRVAGHLAFSPDDVSAFESRSACLEELISRLAVKEVLASPRPRNRRLAGSSPLDWHP
jgi:hypothetical protein